MKVLVRASRDLWIRAVLVVLAGLCGLAGLLIEIGARSALQRGRMVEALFAAAVVLFLAEQGYAARLAPNWRTFVRARWPGLILTVLLILQVAVVALASDAHWLSRLTAAVHVRSLTQLYLVLAQCYVLALFAVNLPRLHTRFASLRLRPGLAFLLVFALLIFMGTGMLCLPRATPLDAPISFLDALFTSTSAVCVTGLIVRDTGSMFTPLGQTVILVLIQLGGLGIMSLTAALSQLLGQGIGIRESSFMREIFQVPVLHEVGKLLRFIVLWTLLAESVGALVLYAALAPVVPDPRSRLFCAVFHSISAFCNAGFSTFSDSLEGLAGNTPVIATISALLIVGGLGFTVVLNLFVWLRARRRRWKGRGSPAKVRLTLQTRVMLVGTVGLLAVGTAALLLLEWRGAFAGVPWPQRLGLAFFQSATCRTAGFNSVSLSSLSPPSLFMMIVLMFIGAGPGSTAGGVKITTLAVVWAELRSIAGSLNQVRLGDREIGNLALQRATVVVASGAVIAALGTFVLLVTEGDDLLTVAFEVISAMGTVGLSLGLTMLLSPFGRVIIILLMFIGRLGILTFAYGFVGQSRDRDVRFPTGNLMIG